MSITVRLAKFGKKHQPTYKVVVANTRTKRDGRFLDVLGHFNPLVSPPIIKVDTDKYQEWVEKGALTTQAVKDLINGKYIFKPYKVKKGKEDVAETNSETASE